jgi:hypothetical protein
VSGAAALLVRPVSSRRAVRPATVSSPTATTLLSPLLVLSGTEYEVEVTPWSAPTRRSSGIGADDRGRRDPPDGGSVPRNLLQCYVEFSAPMREAGSPVRLLDAEVRRS